MTDEVRIPRSVETLLRSVSGAGSDDERAMTFARGLALGALVGAAIAGSTIWQRRHGRATIERSGDQAGGAPVEGLSTDL
jgi:hypothetical protein